MTEDQFKCRVCGADSRFDERCNPVTHGADKARKAERAAIVAWLRDRLSTPEITRIVEGLAGRIERGEHEEPAL